jgi:serine/threonine-protein kinase
VTVAIGQLVGGKYRIVRLLGRGGMGAVYEAEHVELGRPVALKVLAPALLGDESAVRRLLREARAAAGIGHENVCEVIDVGRADDDSPYLVMPLLRGRPLAAAITESAPFPVDRAAAVAAQILDALEAAHARGIVHRDLKPENVFLTRLAGRDDIVKVLDFGICKVSPAAASGAGATTTTGLVLGTPAYMSPEQARGETDPRADVWAAGVILFQMLAGRLPFEGANYNLVVAAVLTAPVPSLRRLRPDLPPPIEDAVLRALERDVDRRHPSAAAFRSALVAACAAAGVPVPEPAAAPRPSLAAAGEAEDDAAASGPAAAPTVAEPWARPSSPPDAGAGADGSPASVVPPLAADSADRSRAVPRRALAAALVAACILVVVVLGWYVARRDRAAGGSGGDVWETSDAAAVVAPPAAEPTRGAAATGGCPEGMALVPAGAFVMGSEGEAARADERPERVVTTASFCIAGAETTRAEWRACEAAGACTGPDAACLAGARAPGDEEAVTCIDARQAAAYCAWAGGRLATEAEWEKAARGGCELAAPAGCGPEDRRTYPWGDDAPDCVRANLTDCGGRVDRVASRPLGDSPYGLHDMAGNVAEWVADDAGGSAAAADDAGGRTLRVVRGGSWGDPPRWVRAASRGRFDPSRASPYIGVRCAADPRDPSPARER